MASTIREFDATQLMQPFCGFDSLSGVVLGTAVTGDVPAVLTGGTETRTFIQLVTSIEDFVQTLKISTSASVQAMLGHGSGRADFAQTLKFHDYSLYLVASIFVVKGTKVMQNAALNPAAAQLLADNSD